MKHKITFLILFLSSMTLWAQENSSNNDEIKTIFGSKPHSHGGYVLLGGGYTQIDGRDAFTSTFRGAWLIDHSLGIGIAATGFSNDLFLNHPAGSDIRSLQGGYGGLLIQPVVAPKFPVHVSFPVVLGAGGVAAMRTHYYDDFDASWFVEDEAYYLFAEPGAEIEFNLVKFIRASVGVSYRFTSSLTLNGYSSSDLRGFAGSFSLSFGKF